MTVRNEFGRTCQQARADKGISLLEFSRAIGVSPSFVCAVETSEKNAPDGYCDKVIAVLALSPNEATKLKEKERHSRVSFRFDNLNPSEARLLAAFQENRSNLTETDLTRAVSVLQMQFNFEGT